LYVITEDRDLGAEIGKIITMSYLKKVNKWTLLQNQWLKTSIGS
jgi:hypothetical protein